MVVVEGSADERGRQMVETVEATHVRIPISEERSEVFGICGAYVGSGLNIQQI